MCSLLKIFGGHFDTVEDGHRPRTHFDNFWSAYLAVFQILTGSDWPSVMYNAINAYGGIKSPGSLVSHDVSYDVSYDVSH